MKRNASRGYSLIEVLIAIAILGTVVMSIMTLFVFGRRNVYSGKQMTLATSVATHVLEDINPMTVVDVFNTFKITSTTATGTNVVAGESYENSIVRRIADFPDATDPGRRYFDRWMAMFGPASAQNAVISLVILPCPAEKPDGCPTCPNCRVAPTDPTTAKKIQIRVVTEWSETTRRRQVFLDTVKLNRSIL